MRLNLLDRADQPLGQNEVRQLAIAKQRIKIAIKFDPAALVSRCLARPKHLREAGPVRQIIGALGRPKTLIEVAQEFVQSAGFTERRNRRDLDGIRTEEHTSELQSLMRNSYAVFSLK